MTISRAASPPVPWPFCPTVSLCSPTEIGPSTLPSTSRSSLPEISPFTLIVGLSHELAGAVVPAGLLLLARNFGAFEFSAVRPEGVLGEVDCDSLFRHTVVLHQIRQAGWGCSSRDSVRKNRALQSSCFGMVSVKKKWSPTTKAPAEPNIGSLA